MLSDKFMKSSTSSVRILPYISILLTCVNLCILGYLFCQAYDKIYELDLNSRFISSLFADSSLYLLSFVFGLNLILLYTYFIFDTQSLWGRLTKLTSSLLLLPLTGGLQFLVYRLVSLEMYFKDSVSFGPFLNVRRIWSVDEKIFYANQYLKLLGFDINSILTPLEASSLLERLVSSCASIADVRCVCKDYLLSLVRAQEKKNASRFPDSIMDAFGSFFGKCSVVASDVANFITLHPVLSVCVAVTIISTFYNYYSFLGNLYNNITIPKFNLSSEASSPTVVAPETITSDIKSIHKTIQAILLDIQSINLAISRGGQILDSTMTTVNTNVNHIETLTSALVKLEHIANVLAPMVDSPFTPQQIRDLHLLTSAELMSAVVVGARWMRKPS